jgi:hypothetical protein
MRIIRKIKAGTMKEYSSNTSSMILVVSVLVLLINVSCRSSDQFEKVPREGIDSTTFAKSNTAISAFSEDGYKIEKNGNEIQLSYKGHKQSFPNIVFIKYFGENYIGLITGLPTFDAGWKYLIFPTYSDLVILNRDNLEVLFRKRVYESVSDLNLKNGYVYFEYGEYPDLQYGRFPFSE